MFRGPGHEVSELVGGFAPLHPLKFLEGASPPQTPPQSFVLVDSVPAALRRPQKKHVLDFQSMSQPKNITDFVYFGRTLIPDQCMPLFPYLSLCTPTHSRHLDCYSRTMVRGKTLNPKQGSD